MPEEKAIAIAENADLILNSYAFTRDESNFRVVNLRSGHAAYLLASGEVSETDMDDVETAIVQQMLLENRRYMPEVVHA